MNDLDDSLPLRVNVSGVNFKVFLYADDIVILANNSGDLQSTKNCYHKIYRKYFSQTKQRNKIKYLQLKLKCIQLSVKKKNDEFRKKSEDIPVNPIIKILII